MASKFHKLGTISCVGSASRWCWDWNSALPGMLLVQNAFPRTWNEAPKRWAKFLQKFSLSYNSATIKVKLLPKPTKNVCCGQDTSSEEMTGRWFYRCRSGNFNGKGAPCHGWSSTVKTDEMIAKVENDRHVSGHDIAKELNIHHQPVLNHSEKTGCKKT